MKTDTAITINAYIADFPKEIQEILEQMRLTVREAAPEAEEAISYGMPTLKLKGNLIHFAAYKNHIGFYPAPVGIEAFKDELAKYKSAKGSVQFPIDQPLPLDLITRIVKFRITQNLEKAVIRPKKKGAAKQKKLSDQEQVTKFIQRLDPEVSKLVETIRLTILSTDSEIGERIKWNNPSYYFTGDMKPFDPKEYKREIAVFNLHKGRVMLVFPTGATIQDPSGLLEGEYKDGRRVIIFKDMADIESKEKTLQQVIKEWLKMVEK